jgi:glycosyltransferase involved in cell wall biosynthesis
VGGLIRSLDIPVTSLGFHPGVPDPRMVCQLREIFRARKPDLIQTWMYHADLIGGLAACFAKSPPVVWGIHHTVAERKALKPATYAVARLNALLSRSLPKKIVYCAEAARLSHIRLGYSATKTIVIPNGFDTDIFHPDASARSDIHRELGLTEGTPLVGLCARFHPDKDHLTFLRAAGRLHAELPDVHFVLWGKGIEPGNETLARWNQEEGPGNCAHFLGQRFDSNRLFAALDIAVLSSFTEAFPAVIGEAMACAVPCVATDAGDSRQVIGDTGIVVPKRDPEMLAQGMMDLLLCPEERRRMGERARQRIIEHYKVEKMAAAYAGLYRDIITGGR